MVSTPLALAGQPFAMLVIITLYVPVTVAEKVATLPGFGAPAGTVHAKV
jgi:hypothetical protein